MRKIALSSIAAIAIATPGIAAAPPFETPAPVAFMTDLSSGATLYAKDADRRMPPASMAKMMTAYVAFDLIKKGELKLNDMATVSPETWKKWHGPQAGSTMFLSVNENVSVENLLYGIIVLSGNDACVVLAEKIAGSEEAFTNLMNQRAKELGLSNSHFGTSNGWPDEGRTYVTARDLAKLATATIQNHPQLYKKFYSKTDFTWGKTLGEGAAITQANRDPLLGRVRGADGLKTGHTEEAGYGFTGSAEQDGRRLVMVLAGLTSSNQRIAESVKFMNWGFGAWRARPIVAAGKRVETAEVQLGDSATVGLVAPRALTVTMPAGTNSPITAKVVYTGPIKAPIAKGQHIADLVIASPDTGEQRMPLVAEKDVAEAGFFGRVWASLTSLFA
ncbi:MULTISPECIES: D-alanyl-D-alanine carboxypeptidase family protein [Sphingomonas]|jgi:D-alanyl-D-alanine carboxypeptidase (penicillin-binding protein 5/6)|uniref:serine-type D-Ala-D-Ala carboxypeptidase n=1 Tax=Sphingomonas hankookensis TaxID=563996 RepID=A0ABR5YGZ7_9SPHN|nr:MULTISPECIES: D-alanyl-D-alanine carboxypeptidase family protein [Sphingomonas]KZE18937.1 peptidase S11 [Sphingomonas hankookensis]PZT93282.1 MAG: D-alanyl-D-alanine carboxypeptidase [Sphingomonas sp.]RSV32508.1 D-alanyl-D-alanine carboxypeptidase [Sphingomonas sp. ABOLH]WCP70858.1 D-alanyl-D-alanine carboxypeptidase [Sphingomonas hankookensis]